MPASAAEVEDIQKTLPEGVTVEVFYNRTELVDRTITTVAENLAEGALLVVFVLLLTLGKEQHAPIELQAAGALEKMLKHGAALRRAGFKADAMTDRTATALERLKVFERAEELADERFLRSEERNLNGFRRRIIQVSGGGQAGIQSQHGMRGGDADDATAVLAGLGAARVKRGADRDIGLDHREVGAFRGVEPGDMRGVKHGVGGSNQLAACGDLAAG